MRTDNFFRELLSYMLKQVNDLLVHAPTMEELEKNLNETLEDGRKNGATFSIKNLRQAQRLFSEGWSWMLQAV